MLKNEDNYTPVKCQESLFQRCSLTSIPEDWNH